MMRWALVLGVFVISAMATDVAIAQDMSFQLDASSGEFSGRLIELTALITVLSIAPGLLIMVTGFTRIIVVLSILRRALGLQQTPPSMLLVSLALFMTAFVMGPVFEQAYDDGVQPLIRDNITQEQAMERIVTPFRNFMEEQVQPRTVEMFAGFADVNPETGEMTGGTSEAEANDRTQINASDVPLRVLVPAFIISELDKAFQIGFLLFLPFLIIDLVTAALLMSMGMMMLPPVIVSLPFKIVFFVMIDGWALVTSSLMKSFGA